MDHPGLIEHLKSGITEHQSQIIVIIPTYNEIENIGNIIERLDQTVSSPFEILVIDDNSPDGTAREVEALQGNRNNLYLLRRKSKLGLGSAYLDGFGIGLRCRAEYIVTMDSDLSHDPIVINRMIEEIENYDLVIGSRYTHGGEVVDFELWRICLSRGGNMIAQTLLDLPIKDATSGFRCYRTSALSELNLEKEIKSHKYIFLVELLSVFVKMGFRIKEIPISFTKRMEGKTKVNIWEMIHGLWTVIQLSSKNGKVKEH